MMAEENINYITEIESLKKDIRELEKKNKKLVDIQNTQGDLFKMIIHDLKGPVGEITANLDLLNCDKSLSELNREYLETAIMGCENLYRMILNILEISKIEEGRMILNKKSFQIDEIIKESIKKIKTIAKQNEICVTMEVKGEAESVNADQEIIERVLLNLLLNAISFSPPQSEIKIIAEPEGEKDFLKVSVADQGKGIPEEFKKKIFDKFSQEVKDGERIQHSTGLGLTFCKMAVEAHKGMIWVESKKGKGSTFSFTISTAERN